jgi:hypothetical protein
MSTSTIPDLKAALLTRLKAATGLANVQITYGIPGPAAAEREWIMLGNARGDQESAAVGAQRREERYVLEVLVSVVRPLREDQKTVTERAYELAGAIEKSIRDWGSESPAFGGVVRWALVTGTDLTERADSQEREAEVLVRVSCAQRI